MSRDEVELLYRVFDQNKDGLLELSGARRAARPAVPAAEARLMAPAARWPAHPLARVAPLSACPLAPQR